MSSINTHLQPGPLVPGPPPPPQPAPTAKPPQENSNVLKRRTSKPTDKNIPEGVEDIVIGDGVQQYKDLREVERRLDAAMMRKRLEIKELSNRDVKRYKTLRIWISNTAENQPWQARGLDENAFDFSTGFEATYRVKLEGRLLDEDDNKYMDRGSEVKDAENVREQNNDDAMNRDDEQPIQRPQHVPGNERRKKLSHFFKSITIEFDRTKSIQPEVATIIEWKRPPINPDAPGLPPAADFDCLEFERKSDENISCTINLVRDENPERYRLSKELSELVDMQEATRSEIVTGIWDYVQALGLQEDGGKRGIRCDDRLRAVCLTLRPIVSLRYP